MPWFWNSFDEYERHVNPFFKEDGGVFRFAAIQSWAEHEGERVKAIEAANEGINLLEETKLDRLTPKTSRKRWDAAHEAASRLVYAMETLLAYDKRLGETRETSDFAHHKDEVLRNWERYENTDYLCHSIADLHRSSCRILEVERNLALCDERFLVGDLSLPESLLLDFKLARDLFSVGFDEPGAFFAGRGLEGVIRDALRKQRIEFDSKPAWKEDFYILIKVLHRLEWKRDGSSICDKNLHNLLQLLRSLRNSGAHPGGQNPNPREIAKLTVEAANSLYTDFGRSRRQLKSRQVSKPL